MLWVTAFCHRGHAVMTVTPRYQIYDGLHDTGLTVPLQLPADASCSQSPAASANCESECEQQQPAGACTRPALQNWARLLHCHQGGVDRVFVDHPLFLDPLDTHGSHNVNTYQHGPDFPDIDLRYSILCQAALAAPVLLWHQPPHHLHKLQLQAKILCSPQTLSGGNACYVGLGGRTASLAADKHRAVSTKATSTLSERDNVARGPIFLAGGIARVMQRAADQSNQHHSNLTEQHDWPGSLDIVWPDTAGKIAYVGNDWPCFPLSQRLHHLRALTGNAADQVQVAVNNSDGGVQANSALASTAAKVFEAHMARLLKSARVAFCIHNLAYQGIFPQGKSLS